MRTLIVLCAGGRVINSLPVYLNRHPDGKLMAEKAVEGIFANLYDEIVYTILKSEDEKYNVSSILIKEIGQKYNIKLSVLEKETNGPADSVYQTIKKLEIDDEFAVRDSLNGIRLKENINGNFVAGLDLTKYDEDIYNVRSKSFIIINEQNQILDVIEKRFKSDIISVGLYGFRKTSDFIQAYERLNDTNYPIKKLYLSNVISYLIGYKQRIFTCVETNFHEDWGTIETWNRIQKKYATIFVDSDKLIGKYYKDKYSNELIDKLRDLSGKDISLVLFTRSADINKRLLFDKLLILKINCIDIVCSVSCSLEQHIVSNSDELSKSLLGG